MLVFLRIDQFPLLRTSFADNINESGFKTAINGKWCLMADRESTWWIFCGRKSEWGSSMRNEVSIADTRYVARFVSQFFFPFYWKFHDFPSLWHLITKGCNYKLTNYRWQPLSLIVPVLFRWLHVFSWKLLLKLEMDASCDLIAWCPQSCCLLLRVFVPVSNNFETESWNWT